MASKVYIENRPHYLLPGAFPARIYEERCLTQLQEGDIAITSRPVNCAYFRYMTGHLGVGQQAYLLSPAVCKRDLAYSVLKDARLLSLLKEFGSDREYQLETYISSPHMEQIAEITGLPLLFNSAVYDKFNTKSGFRRLAAFLNLPVPPGIETGKYTMLPAQKFLGKHKDIIIKYDSTLGGCGVFRASSPSEMNHILKNALENRLVVEKYIHAAVHGSVQLVIDNGGCHYVADECFLQDNSFKGFCYPARFDSERIVDMVKPLAALLLEEGVVSGWFGLDFMIDENGQVFFHDFNPRKTAVSYVLSTVARIMGWPDPIPRASIAAAYVYLKAALTFEDIYELMEDMLLKPGEDNSEGIILINPGLLLQGLVNIVAVSPAGQHMAILEKSIEALAGKAEQKCYSY